VSSQISSNLQNITAQIDASCSKVGRTPNVSILAATKGRSIEQIKEAASLGITLFGENYLQEAEKKITAFPNMEWHFIGHLQSNKAKKAVELFNCIQSVDSAKLASKISDAAEKPFPIFLEVNIGSEESKFGVLPENIPSFYNEVKDLPNLAIRGLMCMAPFIDKEQTRSYFQNMKQLAQQLSLKELSMGMSNDYPIAIEEGATIVRLGTVLFGAR
tara:strand:+ start:10288 stop:10935 length:648 start_codon:yes stop_codon:yes gene_type:complete